MRTQRPIVRFEEAHRHAGVVLNDRRATRQQELAHFREAVRVHEVGGALHEAVASAQVLGSAKPLSKRRCEMSVRK